MSWENKKSVPQPIADKIRRHFLNANTYRYVLCPALLLQSVCIFVRTINNNGPPSTPRRQPTVDIASDESSSDDDRPDLSASFEKILESRRTKQLAAMSQTPAITVSSPTEPATSATPQPPQSHDADTSHINRMFNNCDLNALNQTDATFGLVDNQTQLFDVPEPSMFEHLSPCKRVGLMRPSTVMEDSCETDANDESARSSIASGMGRSTAELEVEEDVVEAATSFATAATRQPLVPETSFETALSYGLAADKRPTSAASSSADYTRDSLFLSNRQSNGNAADSLDYRRSQSPAVADGETAFDDTLEVVEYDNTTSKYVLKPVRQIPAEATNGDTDADVEDDVIVLDSDSSPDISFHTAHDNMSVKKERQSGSVATTATPKALLFKRSFYEDQQPPESADAGADNVIDLDSSSDSAGSESTVQSEAGPTNDDADTNTRPAVRSTTDHSSRRSTAAADSMMDDSLALDVNIPDEFNDTIERMDYLMDLGRRIQHKQLLKAQTPKQGSSPSVTAASSAASSPRMPISSLSAPPASAVRASPSRTPTHRAVKNSPRIPSGLSAPAAAIARTTPAAKKSPRVAAAIAFGTGSSSSSNSTSPTAVKKLFRTPIARNSPILKAKTPSNVAATSSSGIFKKPTTITPSAAQLKKTTPSSALGATSRIPKPRSAGKANFDYVRSPIGAYIGKRAPNPMQQKVTIERDFLDSTYCAGASKELDFTLPAQTDENRAPDAGGSVLPMRAYGQTERRQVRTY